MTGPRAARIDEVLELFDRWGRENYDEDLSQLDHALQTAALARAAGATDAMVAAALLHDVGHLLDLADPIGEAGPGSGEPDDLRHEARGAAWLSGLFGTEVTAPIALHVRAKRYRVAVEPGYAATLSAGSTASLARQGGPLSVVEVQSFEANPRWQDAVALRTWDDQGKVEGLEVDDLESYRRLLIDQSR